MKKLFCSIVFATSLAMLYGENYSAPKKDAAIEKNDEGYKYTVSVSISELKNLPSGYSFDTSKDISKSPDEVRAKYTSSSNASGELVYLKDNLPGLEFTITMSGFLNTPPGGSGSQPTWSAEFGARPPFYVESENSKDIISLVGKSVTFTAHEGSNSLASKWLVTRQGGGTIEKNNLSTTFKFPDDISATSWKIPGTNAVDGNSFSVKGIHPTTNDTDEGTLKIIAPATVSLSESTSRSNSDYGKSSSEVTSKTFIRGDQIPKNPIQLVVTTKPPVSYDQLPIGWIGVSPQNASGDTFSTIYTADTVQPKLKGKIIPDVLGCMGYLYAGGENENYQKFIRFIKFGTIVIPSPNALNLYLLKNKSGFESAELLATIHPSVMLKEIDKTTKFEWSVERGAEKVDLIVSGERNEQCKVIAKSLNHLSEAVDDITVKVCWDYNGTDKAEKKYTFTVRFLSSFQVIGNQKTARYTWFVTYRLMDQFGVPLPDNVCNGIQAHERFTRDVWTGVPDTCDPIIGLNRLTDEFTPPAAAMPSPPDGNGHQIITIDHLKREHDIFIDILGSQVQYTNVIYQRNQ